MPLTDKLKDPDKPIFSQRSAPLWEGPESSGPNGGCTFSLLSRFLNCRERFRLLVVEGLRTAETFNHRIHFGNMWHVCEEALAKGNDPTRGNKADRAAPLWEADLTAYCRGLIGKYPTQQAQVDHWYHVCKATFPLYVDYWAKHPDVTSRTPLLQEQVFDVPYKLPSGRVVRLRGKWDSVDLVGSGKTAGVWLMENKTKGDIQPERIQRQMSFDLQTMIYMVALQTASASDLARKGWSNSVYGKGITDVNLNDAPIVGVRYNVIRRPLSGGKGTIVRHKARGSKPEETKTEFYSRLTDIINEDPSSYFMRWNVKVTPTDIERFRHECLNNVLEQLCCWWDEIKSLSDPFASSLHFRFPYGADNWLTEGGFGDVDNYLETRSTIGLQRVDSLFGELQ